MMMMMMRPYKTWNINLFPQVNQTQIYFGAAWFWKVCQVTASVLCSAADATLQVHEISQQCVLSRMLSFPLIQIHQEFSFGHCENWQNAAKHFTNSWYNLFSLLCVLVWGCLCQMIGSWLQRDRPDGRCWPCLSAKMRENLFWDLSRTCENPNATKLPNSSALANRATNTNNTQPQCLEPASADPHLGGCRPNNARQDRAGANSWRERKVRQLEA